MTVYLDCNATAPLDPEVLEVVVAHLATPGNAASRTHEYGVAALRAVQHARGQIAEVVAADRADVILTSGATEANNIAVLGLGPDALARGQRHVVTSTIEHKAVLEPVGVLASQGFEITFVPPLPSGELSADQVLAAVRDDTALVSIMHVNNETGVLQPLTRIADGLAGHQAVFHTDAAQGFGKELESLRHPRIDLISISGHKIYAPQGVGALIARQRSRWTRRLHPLLHGGGQESGLRPGTVPVALVAGLGQAAQSASRDQRKRLTHIQAFREQALAGLASLGFVDHCQGAPQLAHVLNGHIPGLDSEAAMVALKGVLAASNGSACTSSQYAPSHVLLSMGLDESALDGALRLSWSHLTPAVDWMLVASRLAPLRLAESP